MASCRYWRFLFHLLSCAFPQCPKYIFYVGLNFEIVGLGATTSGSCMIARDCGPLRPTPPADGKLKTESTESAERAVKRARTASRAGVFGWRR